MKSLFNLPKEPVDQYRLDWFHISVDEWRYYITPMYAVYHVNTSWDKYKPDNKGGVDIIKHWMIAENSSDSGRNPNWNWPIKNPYWEDCFLTRKEAVTEVEKRLNFLIAGNKDDILHMEEMIRELEKTDE